MMPAIGLLLVRFRKCSAHLRRCYDLDIADLGNSACVQELLHLPEMNFTLPNICLGSGIFFDLLLFLHSLQ